MSRVLVAHRQVASRIAAANATVILRPVHCFPNSWEKSRCSDDAIQTFKDAGVTLAVAPVRGAAYYAGRGGAR